MFEALYSGSDTPVETGKACNVTTEYMIEDLPHGYLHMKRGSRGAFNLDICATETFTYLTGAQNDAPRCVSPILARFAGTLHDDLDGERRHELTRLVPSLLGTADDGLDERRGYMALDWLIRTWLPTWLDLVPSCADDARKLRELGRIVDLTSARSTQPMVRQANEATRAADPTIGRHEDIIPILCNNAAQAAAEAQLFIWPACAAVAMSTAMNAAHHAAAAAASDSLASESALVSTMRATQLAAIDLLRDMISEPTGLGSSS